MIQYEIGTWGILFIFKVKGSVFPKAMLIAGTNAVLTAFFHWYLVGENPELPKKMGGGENAVHIWAAFNFVLGFLVIFRTQQAYSKFWEGGTLLLQVRGEWFNATSTLFAFCTPDETRESEVEQFQHYVVRLMSMLYCSALQSIAMMKDENFDILDISGIDKESIAYLEQKRDKAEIIMQWVQRLICDNIATGVLSASPPLMSRVFQELSRGIVNVQNARKISVFLFPFPYAQMITVMLMLQWVLAPMITFSIVSNWWWAGGLSFLGIFTYWAINFIAMELEMPYGDDDNDLPVPDLQKDFNMSLRTLLEGQAQFPPVYHFSTRDREARIQQWSDSGGPGPAPDRSLTRWSESSSSPRGCSRTSSLKLAEKQQGKHLGQVVESQLRPSVSSYDEEQQQQPQQLPPQPQKPRAPLGEDPRLARPPPPSDPPPPVMDMPSVPYASAGSMTVESFKVSYASAGTGPGPYSAATAAGAGVSAASCPSRGALARTGSEVQMPCELHSTVQALASEARMPCASKGGIGGANHIDGPTEQLSNILQRFNHQMQHPPLVPGTTLARRG